MNAVTKSMIRALVAGASASLILSACATTGSNPYSVLVGQGTTGSNPYSALVDQGIARESFETLSDEEQQLRTAREEQLRRTERRRVIQGAAVGCLTTTVWENRDIIGDFIRGRQSRQVDVEETAAWCAGGAALGAAAGAYVNARTRPVAEALNREEELIAAAREDVEYYSDLNAAAEQLVEQQREKVRRLNAQYNTGAITAGQYRAEIASAETNLALLNEKIAEANANIQTIEQDLNSNDFPAGARAGMTEQLDELREQRDRLQQQLAALTAAYDAVPPDFRPSAQV